MQNPFESGQIKNYILLYVGVVVIMILFFIASTLFHDVKEEPTKTFEKGQTGTKGSKEIVESNISQKNHFKLLDKNYGEIR